MKATMKYYFSVFLRRLPWFLIPAIAITAIGVIVAVSLPPTYVAQTRFVVEGSQIPNALAPPSAEETPLVQLQLIQQRLLSRANLLDIARRHNVFPNMGSMTADDLFNEMYAATTIKTQAPRGGVTQMSVAFEARTAQIAAAVTNEFLTLVQRMDVESRTGRASQTLDFFRQEEARLSAELSAQSAKILEFNNLNADALPEGQEFRMAQQVRFQDRVSQLERDIASLNEQRARLIQIFEATGRVEAIGGDNRTPEQRQLEDLRRQLDSALAVYAPSNPRIKVLESRIAQLQTQVAAAGGDSSISPLDLQLGDIDKRVTDLRAQQADLEARLVTLADQIGRSMANGATMAALQRDYNNIQSQYNQVRSNMAQASTSERIEAMSRGQRISVLEQPSVPSAPTSPNRKLIVFGGVVAGIAAGLALIVLLELLNRSPRRPEDLVRKLGIMPLATIPYVRSSHEMVWQRGLKAALILLILIGVPALVWGIHTYYQPLDLLAARVMTKMGL